MGDPESDLREKAHAFWMRILSSYEQRRDVLRNAREFEAMKNLAELGIFGSTIKPNLNRDEALGQAFSDLHQSFEPELQELRVMLR